MARRTSINNTRLISELNMGPLLDLVFLLLITFMITMPLVEQGIPVNLPKGDASELDQPVTASVTMALDGKIYLDNLETPVSVLAAELKNKAATFPDLVIMLRADEALSYGAVVAVMRELHDAGLSRIALVTAPGAPAADASGATTAAP